MLKLLTLTELIIFRRDSSAVTFLAEKKSSSIWGSIGKIFAVTALITAVALGSIATFGGVAVSAVALSTGLSYTAFAITGTAITAGIVGTAAATLTAVAASIDEGIKVIQRSAATKVLKGRYTEVPSGYKGWKKMNLERLEESLLIEL